MQTHIHICSVFSELVIQQQQLLMNERMHVWMDGWMDGWMYVCMYVCSMWLMTMIECMHACMWTHDNVCEYIIINH